MQRLDYDMGANEDGLQGHLLRAHRGDGLIAPLALIHTFSALADLRRTSAFGAGIHPDALGVVRAQDRLALLELKHPNYSKAGSSALHQVLAYAGYFGRAVDADLALCVDGLAAAFTSGSTSREDVNRMVSRWSASRTSMRPLGDLALVCVISIHSSWEHVVALVRPYGIDLRAVHASVLLDNNGEPCAVGWFEIDPSAALVEFEHAFKWSQPFLQYLAAHPVASVALPSSLVCRRSDDDFSVRISVVRGGRDTLVATFSPMTRNSVLVEILDPTRKDHWKPFLVNETDQTAAREIEKVIASAVEGSA